MKRNSLKRMLAAVLVCVLLTGVSAQAAGGYADWKQHDSRWAAVTLTNKTMKQVGCLVTTVAILAVEAGCKTEDGFDPGVLAEGLKKVGGFAANDLVWEKIPLVIPGFEAPYPWVSLSGSQAEKLAKMKDYLEQGYSIAAAVRNEGHWVAVRQVTGSSAVMADPAGNETDLFAKYSAAGVTRLALLKATTAQAPEMPAELPRWQFVLETFAGLLGDLFNLEMLRSVTAFFGDVLNLLKAVIF